MSLLTESLEQILIQLEQKAPEIAASLQPGLTCEEIDEMECIHTLEDMICTCIAIHSNGKIFFNESPSINIYDLHTRKAEANHKNDSDLRNIFINSSGGNFISKSGSSKAISPDGKTIVRGNRDKTIKVWDLETEKLKLTLEGHTGFILSIAISPDQSTIVSGSGSGDETIRVWDFYTGECIRIIEGHQAFIYSLAISPDGKTLVSASGDKIVKIWGLES